MVSPRERIEPPSQLLLVELKLPGKTEDLEVVVHPAQVPLQKENGPTGARSRCLLFCGEGQRRYDTAPALGRERGTAAAARLGIGIHEREPARQPFRDVVERRAVQVEIALRVADDLHPVDVELLVVGTGLVVELERIREAGAPAPLHAHAEEHVLEVLRAYQLLDLLCRLF